MSRHAPPPTFPSDSPVLYSARTELSPFAGADHAELVELFRDRAVRRYLLDDELVSAEWVSDEIEASDRRFEASGAGLWSARLEPGGPIAGFAGFRPFFEPPELQLLYGFLPEHWGRGLATEVSALLRDHAFAELGFSTLRAAIDAPNVASGRVLERIGLLRVGQTGTGPDGTVFYALERSGWETLTRR